MSIGQAGIVARSGRVLQNSPMPRKKKMGRPAKKASERKSQYVSFPISKAQLKAYKAAADKDFKGNVSDFIRAACDAAAAQRDPPET
jgi:hypothetical protein